MKKSEKNSRLKVYNFIQNNVPKSLFGNQAANLIKLAAFYLVRTINVGFGRSFI